MVGVDGLTINGHGRDGRVTNGVPVGEHEVGEKGLADVEEAAVDGFEAAFDEEQEDAQRRRTSCLSSS